MQKMKCKVVMLATKNILKNGKQIYSWCELLYLPTESRKMLQSFVPQHLYLLSDEEIQVGDYVIPSSLSGYSTATKIDTTDNTIEFYNKISSLGGFDYIGRIKKVVATTDTSLNLPMIPQDFLQEYIESNGNIDKVYLNKEKGDYFINKVIVTTSCELNNNNEVIISKVKESWTREEVIELLKKYGHYLGQRDGQYLPTVAPLDKWIPENL